MLLKNSKVVLNIAATYLFQFQSHKNTNQKQPQNQNLTLHERCESETEFHLQFI